MMKFEKAEDSDSKVKLTVFTQGDVQSKLANSLMTKIMPPMLKEWRKALQTFLQKVLAL